MYRAEYRLKTIRTYNKRKVSPDFDSLQEYRASLTRDLFPKLKNKIRKLYNEEPDPKKFQILFCDIWEKLKLKYVQKFPDGTSTYFAEKTWRCLIDQNYPDKLFRDFQKEYNLKDYEGFKPKKHHIVQSTGGEIIQAESLLHPVYGTKNNQRQVVIEFPCISKKFIEFKLNDIYIDGKILPYNDISKFADNEGWNNQSLMMSSYKDKNGWLIIWDEIDY